MRPLSPPRMWTSWMLILVVVGGSGVIFFAQTHGLAPLFASSAYAFLTGLGVANAAHGLASMFESGGA